MSIFVKAIHWIAGIFSKAKDDLAKAAVFIVKDIQPVLFSPAADALAGILDAITKTTLPETVLTVLRKDVPLFITAEGVINTLTADSTEADVKAALAKVISYFPALSADQRAQFWTTLAATIYIDLHKLANGDQLTFAEAVVIIEESYQAYVAIKK